MTDYVPEEMTIMSSFRDLDQDVIFYKDYSTQRVVTLKKTIIV